MGMEHRIVCDPARWPDWDALHRFFKEHGYPLTTMMIDGELAFPDETPASTWREVRVGTPGGMVTLRREPDGCRTVTWGNAEGSLREAWHAVTWGLATLSGGTIDTPSGRVGPDALTAELPPGMRQT